MGLLRFIFIIICIIWIIRFVLRILIPLLFQNLVNKAQQQTHQYRQPNYQQRKPEGVIKVEYVPPKPKEARAADKAGEFIDYEEIK